MNYKNPFGDIRYEDNSFYDPTRGFKKAWSPTQTSGNAEAECVAQGGTWDPVNQVCNLPRNESEQLAKEEAAKKGVMDLPGQALQAYNPDINYENAYLASNGQLVGTIDSGLNDPYNSGPTASASDFRVGSSNSPTDYSTAYALPDGAGDLRQNQSQAVSNVGYDIGEVDPRLAQAAGYKQQASVEDAMANGNYGVALDLGATPEEIEASGGPSVPVIAKIISNVIGGGPIAGIIKAITGVSLKDSIQNSALRGKILDTISSEFKSSWKASGYQPGEGTGLAGKPLAPGDPGYQYTDISGGAGQSTDPLNWYFGTGKWESKHPTNISHSQQYGSDNPGYGQTNASGLGRDFNYDRFGNRRTAIPTGIKPGSAYWNSTTGAWTDKKSGVPLGGSVNKKDKDDDGGSSKSSSGGSSKKAPVVVDNRDRESAGQKAQKAANRAQLSSNVAKTRASTTSQTYDGWGENDGGFIPAWKSHVKPAYNNGGMVGFGARLNKGGSVPMFANDGSMANHPFDREGEQFDTVDAVLTPGEFVIDADSTHVFKNVLEKINEWEPGDNPSLGGLLSKKGEKMTITKDLGNGRKMNITSGEEDDLMMADAEAMLATEAQPQQLNLGGILKGAASKALQSKLGGLFGAGGGSTSPTGGQYSNLRQNAANARNAQKSSGLLSGGINSLGRGQDSSAAQLAGAGLRTNSTGSWGPNGYQGASFSQNTPGQPDFSGQANAIGQGFQEAGNADADYEGSLANIERMEFQDSVAAEQQAYDNQQDSIDAFEGKTKDLRNEVEEFRKGNEALQDAIRTADKLAESVKASGPAWAVYVKNITPENLSGIDTWWAKTTGGSFSNETNALTYLTANAMEKVQGSIGTNGITQSMANSVSNALALLDTLATAALKAQGPGVKTNFDFAVARQTIANLAQSAPQVVSNVNQFIRLMEDQIKVNEERVGKLNARMDSVASSYGLAPEEEETEASEILQGVNNNV